MKNTITAAIQLCLLFVALLSVHAQDAQVLTKITRCEVSENLITTYDTIVFRVNNRAGEEFTQMVIPFSKMSRLSGISGWIEDESGKRIKTLRPKDIAESSDMNIGTLYADCFVKSFELRHNVYPYRLVYTYKFTRSEFLNIVEWTPVYKASLPTEFASLTVVAPLSLSLDYHQRMINGTKKIVGGKDIVYEWKSSYTKELQPDVFSNKLDDLVPSVRVKANVFRCGEKGASGDWKSLGDWYCRLTKGLNDLTEQQKIVINSRVSGVTDTTEIVRILYHYLQDNTRYINVSLGIGSLKPYPASYVALNKFGDCKALTNYMKSMLDVVGIKSYYALIEGDDKPSVFYDNFPSFQFNHIILVVPLKKDTLYLENTSGIDPFRRVGLFIQNRKALLIAENASRLIQIPAFDCRKIVDNRNINIFFSTGGDADVDLSYRFRGSNFDDFNALKSLYDQNQQDRIVREYMPFQNYNVNKWSLNKPDRNSVFIELKSNLKLLKCLKPLGAEFYFSTISLHLPDFKEPARRILPVSLPYPIHLADTINYHFPPGFHLKHKPEDAVLTTKFGTCEIHYTEHDEQLSVVRHFLMPSATISLKEYPDFYSFVEQSITANSRNIVITNKNR